MAEKRENAISDTNEFISNLVLRLKTQNKEKIYDVEVMMYCLRDSHKGIIIGKNGAMLKKIGSYARMDLEKMLDTSIPVPRDYEQRSAEEYEAYKKSVQYQLRNKIIPGTLIFMLMIQMVI